MSACAAPQKTATRSDSATTPTDSSPRPTSSSKPPPACAAACDGRRAPAAAPAASPGSSETLRLAHVERRGEQLLRIAREARRSCSPRDRRVDEPRSVAGGDGDLAPADAARERAVGERERRAGAGGAIDGLEPQRGQPSRAGTRGDAVGQEPERRARAVEAELQLAGNGRGVASAHAPARLPGTSGSRRGRARTGRRRGSRELEPPRSG